MQFGKSLPFPLSVASALSFLLIAIPPNANACQQSLQIRFLDQGGTTLEDQTFVTCEGPKTAQRVIPSFPYPSGTAQAVAAIYELLLDYDTDPHVGYEFSFDNDSDGIIGISLLYRIDTLPFRGTDWVANERLDLTLTDRNGDGATLTPALAVYAQDPQGTPILTGYRTQYGFRGIRAGITSSGFGFFDGLATSPISIAPGIGSQLFEFVAGPAGFADYIDSVSFPLFGDAPWNNLGIEVAFQLSPGDRVNIRGLIDVAVVPLPAALPLLLAALGSVSLFRRR